MDIEDIPLEIESDEEGNDDFDSLYVALGISDD